MEIEELILNLYKSLKPEVAKVIFPIVNIFRSLNNKPAIPLKEKLCEGKLPTFSEKTIMIHGVSVGEILSLEYLIKTIKNQFSDCKIVLTVGTAAGNQVARKKYAKLVDDVVYFPIDIYKCCEKFLNALKPVAILIAETEIWPNFAACCKEKKIPLFIINGRISDKSYPTYKKFSKAAHLILKNYTGIYCQSELDKGRFISLGSNPKNTELMKNLKFEIEKQVCDIDLKAGSTKVLVAGSTHDGEEAIIAKVYKQLRAKVIDLKLIIAPRHLNRLEEVKKVLKDENLRFGLRSKGDDLEGTNNVLILDTMGELQKIYSLADIVFIGGSFCNVGGHNPLEATIYSKPVITGPNIRNFIDIYAILQKANAAIVVKDEAMLYPIFEKLISDENCLKTMSKNCEKCIEENKGALDFIIGKLKEVIK